MRYIREYRRKSLVGKDLGLNKGLSDEGIGNEYVGEYWRVGNVRVLFGCSVFTWLSRLVGFYRWEVKGTLYTQLLNLRVRGSSVFFLSAKYPIEGDRNA